MKNNTGFTLVELIVVVTILAILSTIGFVSYSSYLTGVRDTNRTSQLNSLSESLSLFKLNHNLPLPENYIEIKNNSLNIAYQGDLGKSIVEKIGYSSKGVDPKTGEYFSYYLTNDRLNYQLMTFLEEDNSKIALNLSNQVNALDYSIKYPSVYGKKLGILTNEQNVPVNKIQKYISAGFIDLLTSESNNLFISHVDNKKSYTFSGKILAKKLETLSLPGKYSAPKDCPEGFISAWGDAGFNQKGFCVAKYEMSYSKNDSLGIPNTSNYGGEDWGTYSYDNNLDGILSPTETGYGKKIASRIDYPIAEISYKEAKDACKSMGKGYHLITNNERMSIARQIEFENNNWSTGNAGNGHIFTGNSDYTEIMGCLDNGGTSYYAYITGNGKDITCNKKRTLNIFNGEKIWDFSGNIWEMVDPNISTDIILTTTSDLIQWTNSEIDNSERLLYGPLIGTNFNNGIGKLDTSDGINDNIIVRGGSYWDSDRSGIYSSEFGNNKDTLGEANLGFRCAK